MMALCCIKLTEISKDGKVTYSSEELKTIDIILDKARYGLAHLQSLWNVSDALGGNRWGKEQNVDMGGES